MTATLHTALGAAMEHAVEQMGCDTLPVTPVTAAFLAEHLIDSGWPAELPDRPELSARETEIVVLVAQGFLNKQIADLLEISPSTVASYMRRIFPKLGVATRAQMVGAAKDWGLVPPGKGPGGR